MVTVGSLWLPIVLSAIFVFVVSSFIHMVLKYHASDFRQLPAEDALRAAIRSASPAPGQYVFPHVSDMKECRKPEVQQKFAEGPVGMLTIRKPGPMNMGPALIQWFIFSLVISWFAAYIASRHLAAGADYLQVFQMAGTAAWLGYAGSRATESIWMGASWSSTWKHVFDGLIYGLVTAGTFGWLWPR